MRRTLAALFVIALATTLHLIVPGTVRAQTGATSIFQVVPTPNPNFNNSLFGVSASSPSDIWAVGDSVLHFDGTAWTAVSPAAKANISSLNGVVDFSPSLAWAVGDVQNRQGQRGQIIEQWNGTNWSIFPGPTFAATDQPSLSALTATSPSDIWAVGSLLSDGGELLSFLFEHFDGTQWTSTAIVSNDAFLLGASADAPNDAWAVGFNGPENDNSLTLAMHFDGTSWKQVPTPSVGSGANQFNGVLALAPNDVWAVGFSTPVAPPKEAATLTLIEHFDGTNWSVVPSPNVGPNNEFQSNRLFGLAANSSTDVWAFGSFLAENGTGQQGTLLEHWDGTKWTIQPSPDPTKKSANFISDLLFAGVAVAPGNIWIVGSEDEAPQAGSLAIQTTAGAASGR